MEIVTSVAMNRFFGVIYRTYCRVHLTDALFMNTGNGFAVKQHHIFTTLHCVFHFW